MNPDKLSGRSLKNKILKQLKKKDFEKSLEEICQLPPRQVVNPLFSFLYSGDENIKWRSITALGKVVSHLAERDLESARIVIRRLMWNLNDESGGIGWGSPEAMGEIMARNPDLAQEFSNILVSYIRPDGNFLEHEILQRGVLWGLGRLAYARPHLVEEAATLLRPYLQSKDPTLRGLAVWTAGALPTESTISLIENLLNDKEKVKIYLDGYLVECSIYQLAKEALADGKI
jgi:hypothetical protein